MVQNTAKPTQIDGYFRKDSPFQNHFRTAAPLNAGNIVSAMFMAPFAASYALIDYADGDSRVRDGDAELGKTALHLGTGSALAGGGVMLGNAILASQGLMLAPTIVGVPGHLLFWTTAAAAGYVASRYVLPGSKRFLTEMMGVASGQFSTSTNATADAQLAADVSRLGAIADVPFASRPTSTQPREFEIRRRNDAPKNASGFICKMKAASLGEAVQKAVEAGYNLEWAELSGAALDRLSFKKGRFANARFTGANLSYSTFENCDFTAADFGMLPPKFGFGGHKAFHSFALHSSFTECRFDKADLTGTVMAHSNVRNSSFIESNLAGTSVVNAEWQDINLQQARMRAISWQGFKGGNFWLRNTEHDTAMPKNIGLLDKAPAAVKTPGKGLQDAIDALNRSPIDEILMAAGLFARFGGLKAIEKNSPELAKMLKEWHVEQGVGAANIVVAMAKMLGDGRVSNFDKCVAVLQLGVGVSNMTGKSPQEMFTEIAKIWTENKGNVEELAKKLSGNAGQLVTPDAQGSQGTATPSGPS